MTQKNTGSRTAPITEQTSSKAVNSAIKAFGTAAGKVNALGHIAAMLVLEHAKAFNDCTGAARLVNAMPKSQRRALMVRWFEMFSPIVVEVKGGEAKAHFAKDGSKKAIKFNLDGARETPWYAIPEANDEPGFFEFDDAVEAVDKLAKRLKRLAEGKGQHEVPEKDRAAVAAIAAMLTTLKMPERPAPAANTNDTQTVEVPVMQVA